MARRQPTGIMVNLISVERLEAKALSFAREHGFPDATECNAGFTPHGFVEMPKGLYALSSEGIGPGDPITEDNPYKVPFYARTKTEKGWKGSCFPACYEALSPGDLWGLATGEKVNLADFIRAFGARLEGNYEAWREVLETAGQLVEAQGR